MRGFRIRRASHEYNPLLPQLGPSGTIRGAPASGDPQTLLSLPLAIWILTHFFSTLPASLEDAALVDGCTPFQVFLWAIFPLAAPGFATSAVLIFSFAWNELLFAPIIMSTPESRTVPVALALFAGLDEFLWATITAATVVRIVPVVGTCVEWGVEARLSPPRASRAGSPGGVSRSRRASR